MSNQSALNVSSSNHIYDVIIIGGGPAGLTAALYASRAGLDTLLIEKFAAGGQITQTSQIDNYPGFESGIDGFSLGMKMKKQIEPYPSTILIKEVTSVSLSENPKIIRTTNETFYSRTIIIATGASHKKLGLPNESELTGHGVHYCAACDGMFYKDKVVAIVGGGNSAVTDALLLSRVASKVFLIHRRDTLRASKIYQDSLFSAQNITFLPNCTVSELVPVDNNRLDLILKSTLTKEIMPLTCDGVFISIGMSPVTSLFTNQIELDNMGYITASESTKTNVPGIFAAGDVRTKAVRQIVTAVSDGAIASYYAEEYLAGI